LTAKPVSTTVPKPQKASNLRTALFLLREPWRMRTALLLSLLVHALLLSIALGGQTFGLPGLYLPWKERRLAANELRILLAPAQAPAPAPAPADPLPAKMANAVFAAVDKPAVGHREVAAVLPPPSTPAAASTTTAERKRPDVDLPLAPNAPPLIPRATAEAQSIPAQSSEVPVASNAAAAAQKQIDQDARERALEQARLEHDRQSAERLRQDAVHAEQAARSEAARMEVERQELARQENLRQERARQDEQSKQDAARQELERTEAARLENARKEATRQEQARQAQLDAAQQLAAKQEAARQEAARQEAARQNAAKQEAARQEVAKQEAARQDAAKQEAARQEAARQEAARQNAAKQEAARQDAAKQELAQRERADQEAKREERLRAIGKQLNEEAAQRDALNRPSRSLLPTVSSLRRGWLYGRADPNADLVLYAQAMSQKIEMNMTFDMVREAVKQPHAQPVVTVAIRADGTIEKVTFVVSSGVPAIDEAIRKVVASQAPYGAFPPALARQYDVIEIRRTWIFDTAIRLQ
jgi:hypothetical protein